MDILVLIVVALGGAVLAFQSASWKALVPPAGLVALMGVLNALARDAEGEYTGGDRDPAVLATGGLFLLSIGLLVLVALAVALAKAVRAAGD